MEDSKAIAQYRHPRNNSDLPRVGTFAQRNKNRPNKIGLTTVEFVRKEENKIFVKNLDALNGTPIFDIKAVMKELKPKGKIKQPHLTKRTVLDEYAKV